MTAKEYSTFGAFFLIVLIFYPSGRPTAWAGLFVLNGVAAVACHCNNWGK